MLDPICLGLLCTLAQTIWNIFEACLASLVLFHYNVSKLFFQYDVLLKAYNCVCTSTPLAACMIRW